MTIIETLRAQLWLLLLLLAILLVVFGALDTVLGVPAEAPGNDAASLAVATTAELEARMAGRNLTLAGTLLAVVIAIPYRRREPWAWWATWLLPVWAISISLSFLLLIELPDGYPSPPGASSGWIWFLLSGGALLLDRRRFFSHAVADRPAPEVRVSPT